MPGVDRERFEAFFLRARLETRLGELVHEVWLMPFKKPAELVKWGGRFFVLHDDRAPLVYREGLLTFTVDPETGMIQP